MILGEFPSPSHTSLGDTDLPLAYLSVPNLHKYEEGKTTVCEREDKER